jgi:recombination associated protein RdgC
MWFKNLKLYRFTQPFRMNPEVMGEKLAEMRFVACGKLETSSFGFVAPAGGADAPLVHATNGCLLICACREEKLLPASVVREGAQERIEAMEAERGSPIGRRERERVLDQVRFELLPRAFSRVQRTFGYIDPVAGYLIVDVTSDARADDFTGALQSALGALHVAFPVTQLRPSEVMTEWVARSVIPDDIELGSEGELVLPGEGGAIVRVRNQDLESHEMNTHLEAGKEVVKIALTYAERIRFVLDDKLNVRRLKFLEVIKDEAGDIEADDAVSRLDADFAVTSLELRAFIARLLELFGGEDTVAMGVES